MRFVASRAVSLMLPFGLMACSDTVAQTEVEAMPPPACHEAAEWQAIMVGGAESVAVGRCGDILAESLEGVSLWRARDAVLLPLPPTGRWEFVDDGRWLVSVQDGGGVTGAFSVEDATNDPYSGRGVAGVTQEQGLGLESPLSYETFRGECVDGMLHLWPVDQPWDSSSRRPPTRVGSCTDRAIWRTPRVEVGQSDVATVRVHDLARGAVGDPFQLAEVGPGSASLYTTAQTAIIAVEPDSRPCEGPVHVAMFDLSMNLDEPAFAAALDVRCGGRNYHLLGPEGHSMAYVFHADDEPHSIWYSLVGGLHTVEGAVLHLLRDDEVAFRVGASVHAMNSDGSTQVIAESAGSSRRSSEGHALAVLDERAGGVHVLGWSAGLVEMGRCSTCDAGQARVVWVADDGGAAIVLTGGEPSELVRFSRDAEPELLRSGLGSARGVSISGGRTVIRVQGQDGGELLGVSESGVVETLAAGEAVEVVTDPEQRWVAAVVSTAGAVVEVWGGQW